MNKTELRDLIFQLLHEKMQGADASDYIGSFVGIQGDSIVVVFQTGARHLAVRVVEAEVG